MVTSEGLIPRVTTVKQSVLQHDYPPPKQHLLTQKWFPHFTRHQGDCTHLKVWGLLPYGTLAIPPSPSLLALLAHQHLSFQLYFPSRAKLRWNPSPKGRWGLIFRNTITGQPTDWVPATLNFRPVDGLSVLVLGIPCTTQDLPPGGRPQLLVLA